MVCGSREEGCADACERPLSRRVNAINCTHTVSLSLQRVAAFAHQGTEAEDSWKADELPTQVALT